MTDDTPSATRRTVLKTVPAGLAVGLAATPAAAANVELSPLAEAAAGWWWSPPGAVSLPKYGSESVPAFHVQLAETEDFTAVEDWVADAGTRDEHDQYRHTETKHTVVAATPKDIGLVGVFDQTDTLVDAVNVEWIDVVQYVSLTEPLKQLPSGPMAASLPGGQTFSTRVRGMGNGIDGGLAYDEDIDDSTLQDARDAANTSSVSVHPTGAGRVVAIVDTGVENTSAMKDDTGSTRILASSKDYAGAGDTGVAAVDDGNGHGTHVAETVCGSAEDSQHDGWVPSADVLGVRVLDDDGSGTSADVSAGVRYAADEDADVMTLSLGGLFSAAIDRAVSYAAGADTLPVAATGNARMQGEYVSHPASNPDAVAVGAVTVDPPSDLKVASFSNPGPQAGTTDLSAGATAGREPDIAAPGTSIRTATQPHLSGTSMAAPHVAGAAVWVLEKTSASTPEDVKNRLSTYGAAAPNAGVTDVGSGGVLDVYNAINEVEPDPSQDDARSSRAVSRDEANRTRSNSVLGGWATRWLS